MTTPETITSEIQKLEPSSVIELFELDLTDLGDTIYRFHAGTNGLLANVVWQGESYTAFPIEVEGFEISGNGQLPRPKIRVANLTGAITLLALTFGDLIGAKVTRKRTLAKYLDAANFPARKNLLTYSDDFNSWTKSLTTVTVNADLDPFGVLAADRIIPTTTSGAHSVSRTATAATLGNVRTASVYVHRSTGERYFRMAFTSSIFSTGTAYFDLDTGLVSNTGSGSTASATSLGGGWWRLTLTATASATGTASLILYSYRAIGVSFAGNGVAGPLVSSAQVEVGTEATDYQPIGASWSQNPDADPTAEFADDVFYIDRKSIENRDVIEFELSASFDVAGVQLPKRQIIQNVCPWRYRGTECGYTGTTYFDASDGSVASSSQDVCGKRLSSCKLRFGANAEIPFGGFPAAGLTR